MGYRSIRVSVKVGIYPSVYTLYIRPMNIEVIELSFSGLCRVIRWLSPDQFSFSYLINMLPSCTGNISYLVEMSDPLRITSMVFLRIRKIPIDL